MIPPNEVGTRNRREQHVDFTLPPLDNTAGMAGVGKRGTIGAILSSVIDKNSMGQCVHRSFSPPPPLVTSLPSVLSSLPSCCYPSMVMWLGGGRCGGIWCTGSCSDVVAVHVDVGGDMAAVCVDVGSDMAGYGCCWGALLGGDVAVWLEMGGIEGGVVGW